MFVPFYTPELIYNDGDDVYSFYHVILIFFSVEDIDWGCWVPSTWISAFINGDEDGCR